MSTVLWANYLADGKVTSDESDKYALYKFARKLDSVCAKNGSIAFSSLFDTTDAQFNLAESELAPGMESTDELMALHGNWIDSGDALQLLEAILTTIESENTRFGFVGNAHNDIVTELKESIEFAEQAVAKSAQYNFAVVM